MATTKITDLTAYTDPVNTDVLPIVDVTSDVTKKVSIANVMKNASLGTNSAPGISFDGDPNTGIYSPGADQVAVTTGGTQRLLIDSAGAVTIAGDLTVNGTTTNINTTNLVIEDKNIILGDVTTPTDVTADGGGITLKGTTDKTINWVDSTDAWTSSERFSYPLGSAAAPTLTFTGDANTGIYSPGADQVAISTNGTGRLFVDASGNVSVVNGTLKLSDGYPINWASGASSIYGGSGASDMAFTVGSTERMRINGATGFLGLGTSAPDVLLHTRITGAGGVPATSGTSQSNAAIRIGGSSTTGVLDFGCNSDAPWIQSTDRTDLSQKYKLLLNPNGGNVGIGTTPSTYRLDVGGNGIRTRESDNSSSLVLGTYDAGGYAYITSDKIGTGSYQPLIFYTGGNPRLTVDTSGRVGIGTTSPSAPLHVNGTANSTAITLSVAGTVTGYIGPAGFIGGSDVNMGYRVESGNNHVFHIGSTERARIDSSGRLLVGTSSARGDFFNTSNRGPSFQVEGTTTNTSGVSVTANLNNDNGPEFNFGKSRGTNTGSSTIVSNGDGLGRISFQGADGSELVPAAYIEATVDGTPGANDMPGRLVFSTTADGASSPTERMVIKNDGDILFGNAITNGSGGVGLTLQRASGLPYFLSNTSSTSRTHYYFQYNGTTVGTIATTTTATAYNTSSDYRLKENVVPLTGAADRLNQLQVHRFNFIADPDTTVDGFIAHEAQAVVPECVTGTKDEVDDDGNPIYQGIDQSKLVPLLTAALQEALAKIETLEARLTAAGI